MGAGVRRWWSTVVAALQWRIRGGLGPGSFTGARGTRSGAWLGRGMAGGGGRRAAGALREAAVAVGRSGADSTGETCVQHGKCAAEVVVEAGEVLGARNRSGRGVDGRCGADDVALLGFD